MKRHHCLFLLSGILAGTCSILCFAGKDSKRPTIQPAALLAQMKSETPPLLLDVRTQEEFQEGHIPGARLMPSADFENQIESISAWKKKPVVVYCRSGVRAGKCETLLREAGFTQVKHLAGDMKGWLANGKLPIEKP